MSTSEKKRLSNIENAKKSTGPKTLAGKHASRRNAIKHGLSGPGPCALELIKDEVAVEYHALAEIARPQNHLEQRLVEQAAVGSILFLRSQAQMESETRRRAEHALPDWDAARQAEVELALHQLPID